MLLHRDAMAEPSPETTPAGPEASLLSQAVELTNELRELLHEHLHLATLELQLAVRTAVTMLALAVLLGLLLVSAWLALAGALALGLIYLGLPAVAAMLIVALLNLTGAGLIYLSLRHKARNLGLPITLATLKPAPDGTMSP